MRPANEEHDLLLEKEKKRLEREIRLSFRANPEAVSERRFCTNEFELEIFFCRRDHLEIQV